MKRPHPTKRAQVPTTPLAMLVAFGIPTKDAHRVLSVLRDYCQAMALQQVEPSDAQLGIVRVGAITFEGLGNKLGTIEVQEVWR